MRVKICPKCNATNSPDSYHCTNCSYDLSQVQAIEKQGIPEVSNDHLKYEPIRGRPPFVVLFTMFFLTIGAFYGLAFFGLFIYIAIYAQETNSLLALIVALTGTLLFLVSTLALILLYGLYFVKKWAWKLAVLWFLFNIISFFIQEQKDLFDYIGFAIGIIIFVMFIMPGTRMYFETYQEKKSNEKLIFSALTILTIIVLVISFLLVSYVNL